MPKGGTRPRSGPDADPNSGRSDRRRAAGKSVVAKKSTTSTSSAITTTDFTPTALPGAGRGGRAPAFPLPKIVRFVLDSSGEGKPVRVANVKAGNEFRKRELEIWRVVWKTPQAVAWERDSWRWPTIAEFCRLKAIIEAEPESNAALVARLREYRNEIGLSPDGLKMNGWAIAPDQLAAKRAEKAPPAKTAAPKATPVRRMRG